jgi:hypothetical protein
MSDLPVPRDTAIRDLRIYTVLSRHGITMEMLSRRLHERRLPGPYHSFRLFRDHYRASEVAAILELVSEAAEREIEELRRRLARAEALRVPVTITPQAARMSLAETAALAFHRSGRWLLRNMPADFPQKDPISQTFDRVEVEAWMAGKALQQSDVTLPEKA